MQFRWVSTGWFLAVSPSPHVILVGPSSLFSSFPSRTKQSPLLVSYICFSCLEYWWHCFPCFQLPPSNLIISSSYFLKNIPFLGWIIMTNVKTHTHPHTHTHTHINYFEGLYIWHIYNILMIKCISFPKYKKIKKNMENKYNPWFYYSQIITF